MLSIDIDEDEAALDCGAKAVRLNDDASDTGGVVHSISGSGSQRHLLGDSYDIAATSSKSVHFSKSAIKRSKYHFKFPSLGVIQPRHTSFTPIAKAPDPACIIRYDETKARRTAWRLHKLLYGGSGDIWEKDELKNTFFVT